MSENKTIDKIIPKCVLGDRTTLGHSADGFLLPCCWCDYRAFNLENKMNKIHKDLYSEHLHLDKIESIEEITNSKEWKVFWDTMFDDPNNAAKPCKQFCGVKDGEEVKNFQVNETIRYDIPGEPVIIKDNNKGYVGS